MEALGFAVTILLCNAASCEMVAVRTQRYENAAQCTGDLATLAGRLLPPLSPGTRYDARCESLQVLCRQIALGHGLRWLARDSVRHQLSRPDMLQTAAQTGRAMEALKILCKAPAPSDGCDG